MNVEIGVEAALFPEKEYIIGIAVVVRQRFFGTGLNTFSRLIVLMYTTLVILPRLNCTLKAPFSRIAFRNNHSMANTTTLIYANNCAVHIRLFY